MDTIEKNLDKLKIKFYKQSPENEKDPTAYMFVYNSNDGNKTPFFFLTDKDNKSLNIYAGKSILIDEKEICTVLEIINNVNRINTYGTFYLHENVIYFYYGISTEGTEEFCSSEQMKDYFENLSEQMSIMISKLKDKKIIHDEPDQKP